MAKLSTQEIIDAIKELSVLELNDLVKACEEEFGVSAAAGVVVAAAGAGDAAAAEEKTEFDVELTEVGPNKVKVIKVVREVTGLGLKEAKDVVDGAPKVVKEGARAREYEDALQWLVDAGLVKKIYRSTAPGLPIAAYDDVSAFKIYLADVGLLRRLALLAPTAFGEGNRLFTEFKGALSENYVLEAISPQFEAVPRYWSQSNPPYEVDFIIQRENDIIPVEVKAEANTEARSLKKYKEKFGDKVKLRVRFSLDNLKLNGDLLNIPLFLADETDRLIGLALNNLKEQADC